MNKKKLLQQIYNNHKNVRFEDFTLIVEAFGFYRTRSNGSHKMYNNPDIVEIIVLQSKDGKAKPYQIKQFFSIVEKYDLKMED